MTPITERYHEILTLRREGIARYGGRLTSDLYGAPVRLSFPTISFDQPLMPHVKLGPFYLGDRPPILSVISELLRAFEHNVNVLELGPGKGTMAHSLRSLYGSKIDSYLGIERDPSVTGPYDRISDVGSLDTQKPPIDIFIASEVVEHMTLETFFEDVLPSVVSRMNEGSVSIIGTPNALAPGSIFGDFTHVQGYTFFDLYALMRLFFQEVDIYRTRYVWSLERLLTLVPRAALCRLVELDWCEGLICVARSPRRIP